MSNELQILLLIMQIFQVAFLWFHDWVPLGSLNDVAAVRRLDSRRRLVAVTLIQSVPYTLGLIFSLRYFGGHLPAWVRVWLWISYGVLFVGQLRAWWLPYLFWPDPRRTARYQVAFGRTHSFLPQRHGIVPNTLHVMLHVATLATLIILWETAP